MKCNKLLIGAILLLPVFLLGPSLGSFHTPVGSPFSDLAISHFPNTYFLQHTILKEHTVPLWNPNILGGYPFDADPLSGLWYPPGWLSLLFPLPFGINLIILLHILAGGIGNYYYLKNRGYSLSISAIGMLCFVLLPKIYAHFGAGHVTLIYAFCLTPWILWSESLQGKKQILLQGVLLTGVVLADIRWLPYALLGWIVNKTLYFENSTKRKEIIIGSLKVLLIAVGISAVFWMPFIQFTSLSTRDALTTTDNLMLSLPPGQIIRLLFTIPGGSSEWVIYVGGLILFLAIIGTIKERSHWTFGWGITAVICLIWSFGQYIPGLNIVAELPGLSMLRVPPRSMFLGDLALVFLAIEGLHQIEEMEVIGKAIKLIGFGLGLLLISMSILFIIISGKEAIILLIHSGIAIVVFGLVTLINNLNIKKQRLVFLIGLLIATDYAIANLRQFSAIQGQESINLSTKAIESINTEIKTGSIYSPSYSIPQDVAIRHGWKLANGIHPLQLKQSVKLLEIASGVANTGYSVVQPPLKTGNPYEDNRNAIPNTIELSKMNVSIIAASFPLNADGLKELYEDTTIWIYKNENYVPFPMILGDDDKTEIQVVSRNSNSIEYSIKTSGGTFVTDQILYPGWVVYDNGVVRNPALDETYFIKVDLPSGEHEIRLTYRPIWTFMGLFISLLSIIILLISLRHKTCNQNNP